MLSNARLKWSADGRQWCAARVCIAHACGVTWWLLQRQCRVEEMKASDTSREEHVRMMLEMLAADRRKWVARRACERWLGGRDVCVWGGGGRGDPGALWSGGSGVITL